MNTQNISTPIVSIVNNHAITTSKAVADFFGKRHSHVLEKIESLDCSPEFTSANFSAHVEIIKAGAVERESKYYEMTKNGFIFLVMGFTGKRAAQFKEAYIARFDEMEATLLAHHQQPAQATLPPPPTNPHLALTQAIKSVGKGSRENYSKLYTRVYHKFQVTSYKDLTDEQCVVAIDYIHSIEGEFIPKAKAVEAAPTKLDIHYPASWIIEQNQPVLKGENRVMGTLCLSLHNLTNPDLQLPLKAILNTLKKAGYTVEAAEAELFALYNQLGKASQLFGLMNTGLKDVLCLTDKGRHQYSSTFPAIPV